MRRHVIGALAAIVLAAPGFAQDKAQSLADIRQELTILFVDLQTLKQELNTTGAATGAGGGSALDRVNAIESEVQRLTAKTEELEFRIDRIVRDGTNQIGDLEFRLCELEEGCDIGALGDTPTLGGGDAPVVAPAVQAPEADSGPQLAVGEQADFKRAQEALASGDFQATLDQLAAFNATYPGSPVAIDVELMRGEALEGLGDVREAAKAYLNAFTLDQLGPNAPDALFHLGAALGQLDQTSEACVTLGEVSNRYPDATEAVAEAASTMRVLGCS